MITVVVDARSLRRFVGALVVGGMLLVGVLAARASWAAVDDPPLPTVAFLARADNPVDALAAAGIAGQLGAPVFLTFPDRLGADAADGLTATNPDVVVLAGGRFALSADVEVDVAELLPDARVVRKAGDSRTSTAVALSTLPGELGFNRPVLAGATVSGDVGIAGELTVAGIDVAATLTDLQDRLDELADLPGRVDTLTADLAAANDRIESLEALLVGVTRTADTLTFAGMNVQVVNGESATASTNGLGNLIVGYGEDHTVFACQPSGDDCQYGGDGTADVRTGSHNVVIGVDHSYTSFGGLVAGQNNTVSGPFSSVSGGQANTASGPLSSVSGGQVNTASGIGASVSGGLVNTASGGNASVSGGLENTASGGNASVSGGLENTASGSSASVAGGRNGSVSDNFDSRIGNVDFPDS